MCDPALSSQEGGPGCLSLGMVERLAVILAAKTRGALLRLERADLIHFIPHLRFSCFMSVEGCVPPGRAPAHITLGDAS